MVATNNKYDYLITRALKTDNGRYALASAMVSPIRRALDYLGIIRKILQVDYIPDGVLPIYEKDIDAVALRIPKLSAAPTRQIEGEQVAIETFEIAVNPTILRSEVRKRRFNVIDRIQARARATIQQVEDKNGMNLLDAAVTASGYTTAGYTTALFTAADLASGIFEMRDRNVIPTKLLMRPSAARAFTSFTNTTFSPIDQYQVLRTGLFGHVYGCDVYLSTEMPANTVYAIANPEFLGVMPIRQDIEVLDSPNNAERRLGWSIYEEIGMSVVNAQGVNKINKTN